jgi:CheY-like chemotaxis protein
VNIIWAKDGKEAVDLCKEKSDINIVLMDIKMPRMDGYEAIKMIKELRPKLPIIVQTAYAMSQDKQKMKEIGADDYISKPINESLIVDKIIDLIRD